MRHLADRFRWANMTPQFYNITLVSLLTERENPPTVWLYDTGHKLMDAPIEVGGKEV
jgi:hypothetical protein